MPQNINDRLIHLRKRRAGTDRMDFIAQDAKDTIIANSMINESWEKRSPSPYTRYALGAMQEVSAEYTRISIETAERVGHHLDKGLKEAGFYVGFKLQGSVPLNVHIRGVSDVDLLNLDTSFYTYARGGQRSLLGLYTATSTQTSMGVLLALRQKAENILKAQFPAAKVDTSSGKAIKISGGSLARPVDVVPSHWYDTIAYQASGREHDRGVTILNKKIPETIDNLPFLHIKHVKDRCDFTKGGLRKAIRLCKNVKADAEVDGNVITLPSFDIAATMYHADLQALIIGGIYELSILVETQRHLDYLARNHTYAQTLMVPDGSRKIFDTSAKLAGLNKLSTEMDELLLQVSKEHQSSISKVLIPA